MATITFPSSPKPQSMVWRLIQPAQTNISGWTGGRQTLPSGRGWWECDVTLPPIVGEEDAREWLAFIAEMNGDANDFHVKKMPSEQDNGWTGLLPELYLDFLGGAYSTGSEPAVKGADQTGKTLDTWGWLPSTTVLRRGQHITIDDQLLRLTADVVSNAAGEAEISFAPAIRVPPANNALIEFRNPYAKMYCAEQVDEPTEPGMVYGFSFKLRESF